MIFLVIYVVAFLPTIEPNFRLLHSERKFLRFGKDKCIGTSCKAEAEGEGRMAGCIGDHCSATCTGHKCKGHAVGGESKAFCSGSICGSDCTGDSCESLATGDKSRSHSIGEKTIVDCAGSYCLAACVGSNCTAECGHKLSQQLMSVMDQDLPICSATCKGDGCKAKCYGHDCTATCKGANCKASCRGNNCKNLTGTRSGVAVEPQNHNRFKPIVQFDITLI